MIKRLFLVTGAFLLLTLAGNASMRGNVRSEFAGKFMIMRKLAVFCRSNNENTSIKALNTLRQVFFRSDETVETPEKLLKSQSVLGLSEKINADVDKIYTGICNLENSLKVSDPGDANDKYMNDLLKFLVISEIGIIVKDQHFFTVRDKVKSDIEQSLQFIRSAMYIPPPQDPSSDLVVLDKLSNLLDLAGYIYSEQIQWLMGCSYALQNLNIDNFTIEGESVFKGFSVSRPPRIYIPITDKDEYLLKGTSNGSTFNP